MSSYRGHLKFAGGLGAVYGFLGYDQLHFEPATAILGAGICTVGGLLPDLDSDSGVPIREVFGLVAAAGPIVLLNRLQSIHLTDEQLLLALAGVFVGIRYGIAHIVKRLSVHRGMFHSIPAMFITGLAVFLAFKNDQISHRVYMAVAVMIGFLSHLVLDELCAVSFTGVAIKTNQFSGTALKLYSKSRWATCFCYSILGGLGFLTKLDLNNDQYWRSKFGNGVIDFVEKAKDEYQDVKGRIEAIPVSRIVEPGD